MGVLHKHFLAKTRKNGDSVISGKTIFLKSNFYDFCLATHFWETEHFYSTRRHTCGLTLMIFNTFDDCQHFWWFSTLMTIVNTFNDFQRFWWLSTLLMIVKTFDDCQHFWWLSTLLMIVNTFDDYQHFCW